MEINTDLKNFINENINLINENTPESWRSIYQQFEEDYDEELAGQLSAVLLASGINPPLIIGEVPRRFLQYQSQITEYKIPDNCTYIGMSAFEDTSITEINIPSTVTGIDYLAFGGTKLKKIKLPNSVKTLENAVFHSCKDLEEVDLGKIVGIGEECFVDCIHLTKLYIPKNIFYFDMNNLYGCTRLKEINYKGTKEQFEFQVADELEDWTNQYKIICTDGEIILQ